MDIDAFRIVPKLVDEYESYIVALQYPFDEADGAVFNPERYENSLLGGITKSLMERRDFDNLIALKRYEFSIAEKILDAAERKGLKLRDAHDTNVKEFIGGRTYFELKQLFSLNWKEMLDYYLQSLDDNQDLKTFLLKKAE